MQPIPHSHSGISLLLPLHFPGDIDVDHVFMVIRHLFIFFGEVSVQLDLLLLSQRSVDCIYVGVFPGLSLLLGQSSCLFLHQYHTVFITIALQ